MKPRPALVLVTTSFPVTGDGSEAAGGFVADLAEALGNRMPVRVVAPGPTTRCERWLPGVSIYRYAAPRRPLSTLKPWRSSDLRAIGSVLRSGLAATKSAVTVGPTGHILALWALPPGHWARSVARETGVPYSVWTLGSDIWSLGRIPLIRGHLRRVLRDATRCYSDGLKLAEDTRAIARRKVEFLPSTRKIAATRSHPRRSSPPYRLFFLGRWHFNKGVDLLIDALEMLSDEDWGLIDSVYICGGGPLDALVTRGVGRLAGAGRPVFQKGYLDKATAESSMLDADFLLLPSRVESIPVVYSDAMKLGCPVICTPVGDLPALVSKWGTGVLARGVSPSLFADAIREVIVASPGYLLGGLEAAAAEFDLEATASRLAELTTSV